MTKVVLVAGGQLEELPSDVDAWVGVDPLDRAGDSSRFGCR